MWWELWVRVSMIQCNLKLGHRGPTGVQTQASEVVPAFWEVADVNAKLKSGSSAILHVTLSNGKSEEFLSLNYSFFSLSNTSHHGLLMYTTHDEKNKRDSSIQHFWLYICIGSLSLAFRCKYKKAHCFISPAQLMLIKIWVAFPQNVVRKVETQEKHNQEQKNKWL